LQLLEKTSLSKIWGMVVAAEVGEIQSNKNQNSKAGKLQIPNKLFHF